MTKKIFLFFYSSVQKEELYTGSVFYGADSIISEKRHNVLAFCVKFAVVKKVILTPTLTKPVRYQVRFDEHINIFIRPILINTHNATGTESTGTSPFLVLLF